ncbi:MAG: hypothetical protein MR671_02675 [Clostridiales bacterium]|nr:hypothetical protein [Clostridiales bacterium]
MRMCDDVITVFNVRADDDKGYDVYIPTVIRGVSWYCEVASTVDDSGLRAANKYTIRIPADADLSGKMYVEPSAYAGGDPDQVFTLSQGDLVIHAEETESLTPSELKAKYGTIVTILGVTDSTRRPHARHWKVVGK